MAPPRPLQSGSTTSFDTPPCRGLIEPPLFFDLLETRILKTGGTGTGVSTGPFERGEDETPSEHPRDQARDGRLGWGRPKERITRHAATSRRRFFLRSTRDPGVFFVVYLVSACVANQQESLFVRGFPFFLWEKDPPNRRLWLKLAGVYS